ncbi:hypothetical protein QTP88_007009 [Uroleucon formosanum]
MISNNVLNEDLQSFSNLEQFVTEHEFQVEADIIKNIKYHCKMLKTTFEEYFKDYSDFFWIRNLLILDLDIPKTVTNKEKESLIELLCEESLKMEFTKLELGEFWIKIKNKYPLLSKKTLLIVLPFTTTYLCKTGFSSMIKVKNKFLYKLNHEPNLRLKLSNTEPDISSPISNLRIPWFSLKICYLIHI